jgi:NADPH2:quinone reductase
MRVVQVRQFGGPEVLRVEECEEPQAGPGQVVIAVEIAGVSFGDTSIRAGKYPFPLPFVPGWEVGGRVIEVGPDGDQSLRGKSVVALTKAGGGYSERVVTDATNVFPIPPELSVEQAVGVFLAGGTAGCFLRVVRIEPGESVLITAAAGNSGSQLVQLVKAAGAGKVIGVAGGQEKCTVVAHLGADVAIDYSESNWTEQVRGATGGQGADVVIDSVGGTIGRQAFELTKNGHGRFAVFGCSSGTDITVGMRELAMRGITMIGVLGIAMTRTEQEVCDDIEAALQAAAVGRLQAMIGQKYSLERASDAHAAIETRKNVGKVLLIS